METQWYMKKHICRNGIEERTKYPVRSKYTKGERAKREAAREARRADSSERQVARLLNENFSEKVDAHLLLEYDEKEMALIRKMAETMDGESDMDKLFKAAQQNLVNFVRRVQRANKDSGAEFLYVGITADIDGKTGEAVRIHHHFVCNGAVKELCKKKWRGYVMERELYTIHGDFTPLAEYLIRQVRTVPGTKRYVPSRNLRQPYSTPPVLVTRYGDSEMHVPKGCEELYRSPYKRGASQYLRYRRPKRE